MCGSPLTSEGGICCLDEFMWNRSQQAALNSVVMGVEEWLQGKIQAWNRERMIGYCHEMLAQVEESLAQMESRCTKLCNKNLTRGISPNRKHPF